MLSRTETCVFQQTTLIWPIKVTKGQTDFPIRFPTHHFLLVFYSSYSAISLRTPFFSRWPWSDLPRSSKVKLIMASDLRHITSYTCSIVTIALSRMETLFFSRWPRSGLSRSPEVKLIMPSDSWHITSYTCSIVTIALSCMETLFFSRCPRSGLLRSPKFKLNMPFDSRHIISYTWSIVTITLFHTETLFSADDLEQAFQGHQRSNWICHSIRDISFPIRVLVTIALSRT